MWPSFVKIEPTRSLQHAVISMTGGRSGPSEPCRRDVERFKRAATQSYCSLTSRGLAPDLSQWHHAKETLSPAEADKHGHPRTGKLSWAATTSLWDGLQPYGQPWLNVLPGQAAASAPAVHHQLIFGCREILCKVSQRICATEARREATSQSEPLGTASHRLLSETRVS